MPKLIHAIAISMALLLSATLAQSAPLHDAARDGYTQKVIALINAGATINARAKNGLIPFDLAKKYNQEKLEGTDAWWRLK